MALFSSLRRTGTRRTGALTTLRIESLEDRAVPASLQSTDFTLAFPSNGDSAIVGASEDGRYVIIQSTASNFIEDQIDTEGDMDLFWVDRQTGVRRLVSAETGSLGLKAVGVVPSVPGQVANAVISADGQAVAFVSKANANRLVDSFFNIGDAGDASADVFIWSALAANLIAANDFFAPNAATELVSIDLFGNAIGQVSSATNPAINDDGSVVAFVSRRDAAAVDSILINDNGDLTPDVFAPDISINPITGSISIFSMDLITQFNDPLNLNLPTAFGEYTGVVQVDPLGRYMSGDGGSFAVVSALNPSKLDTTFPPAPPGTIDAYYITFSTIFTQDVILVSSQPGLTGTSVGGQVANAIIPKDAPNTIVFSATVPGGSPGLVPGYVNQNGNTAELYWRQIFGVTPQPAVLVTAANGSTTAGANAPLDLAAGNFAVSKDGSKVFFTSPATNLVGITDTNNANDVFVRNIGAGMTSAISVTANGNSTGNAASSAPRPTSDGWLVAFESKATNLVSLVDTNNGTDIFVRNLDNNTTGVASASSDNVFTGNAPSSSPVIGGSKTNAVVLFNTKATNLDTSFLYAGNLLNVFAANAPIPASNASRIMGISGGVNGFVSLTTFDASGNLISGPPIAPFPGFRGEIRVAAADVTGDGVVDLIAGAGPGGGPRVRVLDGVTLQTVYDIFAFEPSFTGGVYVAAGDFNGDGFAEIVVGAGENGGPRILVYDGKTLEIIADILAFEESFRGGVRVAIGDFNGDGILDLIAAAGEGGGPRIKVINGATLPNVLPLADFFAFEQSLRNGTYVGAGDVNGDGLDDIVAGAGPGGAPRVSVFDANTLLTIPAVDPDAARIINYFAYDQNQRDGVRVAIKNADGDGVGDIITGPGSGPPLIRVFSTARFTDQGVPQQLSEQFAFDEPVGRLGAFVG